MVPLDMPFGKLSRASPVGKNKDLAPLRRPGCSSLSYDRVALEPLMFRLTEQLFSVGKKVSPMKWGDHSRSQSLAQGSILASIILWG